MIKENNKRIAITLSEEDLKNIKYIGDYLNRLGVKNTSYSKVIQVVINEFKEKIS